MFILKIQIIKNLKSGVFFLNNNFMNYYQNFKMIYFFIINAHN